ncbi:MAG: hypothetical protein GY904_05080 [Planctomycetaceae bacterium]|nr:hypothetical protein [Planctomycetaceae bacterium]
MANIIPLSRLENSEKQALWRHLSLTVAPDSGSGPIRSGPIRSGLVRSGLVRSGLVRSGAVRSGAVRTQRHNPVLTSPPLL